MTADWFTCAVRGCPLPAVEAFAGCWVCATHAAVIRKQGRVRS